MKKFGIDSQRRGKLFLIFIFHLSIYRKSRTELWNSVLPALAREQRVLVDEKIRQNFLQAVIQTFSKEPKPLSA
jgi:hypothetical protein